MNHSRSDSDIQFQTSVEDCSLPVEDFTHRAHLRLAYCYLTQNSPEESFQQMTSALKNLLAHNQVDPGKYHVTLTLAWLLAVNHFMQNTVASVDADSFIQSNEQLMDVNLLETHYSQSLLYSDKAREHFVEPDISPIPTYG